MGDAPVVAEVFDFIDDFLDKATVYSVAGSTPLDRESSVLAFCENFFAQFFQNEMRAEITSLSGVSAQRAGVLRRRLPSDDRRRRLIRHFQRLCKIHPDLVGETYGSGGDERAEFFFSELPDLLSDIKKWAIDSDFDSIHERIERTIDRAYDRQIRGVHLRGAAVVMEDLDTTKQIDRLVELVRLDYDATLRAMHGFVQTGGQIRAAGIAAWGVVVGLALRDTSWELAVLTLGLVLIFGYADAFHAALYRRAFSRAVNLETLLDAYINVLGIDADDDEAEAQLLAKLETHRFGMNRSLGKLTWHHFLGASPRAVFRGIYPALLVTSSALVVVFAVS